MERQHNLPDASPLTPRQVADFFQVKTDTVLSWIHSGDLPAFDVSRPGSRKPRWRITLDALEAFQARRMKQPPPKVQRRRRKPCDVIEFFK